MADHDRRECRTNWRTWRMWEQDNIMYNEMGYMDDVMMA